MELAPVFAGYHQHRQPKRPARTCAAGAAAWGTIKHSHGIGVVDSQKRLLGQGLT